MTSMCSNAISKFEIRNSDYNMLCYMCMWVYMRVESMFWMSSDCVHSAYPSNSFRKRPINWFSDRWNWWFHQCAQFSPPKYPQIHTHIHAMNILSEKMFFSLLRDKKHISIVSRFSSFVFFVVVQIFLFPIHFGENLVVEPWCRFLDRETNSTPTLSYC